MRFYSGILLAPLATPFAHHQQSTNVRKNPSLPLAPPSTITVNNPNYNSSQLPTNVPERFLQINGPTNVNVAELIFHSNATMLFSYLRGNGGFWIVEIWFWKVFFVFFRNPPWSGAAASAFSSKTTAGCLRRDALVDNHATTWDSKSIGLWVLSTTMDNTNALFANLLSILTVLWRHHVRMPFVDLVCFPGLSEPMTRHCRLVLHSWSPYPNVQPAITIFCIQAHQRHQDRHRKIYLKWLAWWLVHEPFWCNHWKYVNHLHIVCSNASKSLAHCNTLQHVPGKVIMEICKNIC